MDNFLANCPICGFHDKDPFQVILHVGTEHSITSSLLDGAFHDEPPPPKTRSSRPRERKSNRSAQIEPRQEKQTPERKTEKPRKDHVRPQARSVRPTPTQPARARQVALNPVQVARSPPSNDESDSIDTTRALTESFRSELLKLQQTIETSSEKQPALAECYICSQLVHLAEYNEHIDVHNQASVASPTSAGSPSSSPPSRSPRSSQSSRSSIDSSPRTPVSYNHDSSSTIVSTRQPQDPKSGRPPSTYADRSVELGPYCDEKRMPTWLLEQHWNGPPVKKINTVDRHGRVVTRLICENQASGVIDLLTRVVSKCDDTDKVYLCHPSVKHVHRMARDGPFCGYFNIQMIISYLQATQPVANALFQNGLPTILDLQVMIEEAWDQGFSEVGREETGGIIGTRKWIGTPEVCSKQHCVIRRLTDCTRSRLYSTAKATAAKIPSSAVRAKIPDSLTSNSSTLSKSTLEMARPSASPAPE